MVDGEFSNVFMTDQERSDLITGNSPENIVCRPPYCGCVSCGTCDFGVCDIGKFAVFLLSLLSYQRADRKNPIRDCLCDAGRAGPLCQLCPESVEISPAFGPLSGETTVNITGFNIVSDQLVCVFGERQSVAERIGTAEHMLFCLTLCR